MQIHGHDFTCIAVLSGTSSPCYASGSEEKVIRILEAPRAFEDTLALGAGDVPHASSEGRSNGAHKQVCNSHRLLILYIGPTLEAEEVSLPGGCMRYSVRQSRNHRDGTCSRQSMEELA